MRFSAGLVCWFTGFSGAEKTTLATICTRHAKLTAALKPAPRSASTAPKSS